MKNKHRSFIAHYEETKNQIFNYLMYRLNFDKNLSEDLLMDIVLKAYENFDSYDKNKGTFKNWIFTITHNHLVNYWRTNENKKTISLEKLDNESLNISELNSTDSTKKDIETQKIKHILSLMNESEIELLTLKYIHDFNNTEISKILEKNEGSTRTGLSRAVDRFRTLYQKIYSK